MRTAMWTYPWDIQDLGADRVVDELRDVGITAISLAASYHAGRFLQPRSPVRTCYYPEDGTIYFVPTPARWADKRITPLVSSVVADGGDVLADLVRQRDAGGLGVSCWTVCLHNTRLGLAHPDAVSRNAFGDRNRFSLCPSHPDARDYVRTLVADLSHGYRPDAIELESPSFMEYAHGYHHEKDGVGLTPEDDFLLSLCFCPACLSRAAHAGIDGEAARATVRRWLGESFEREVPRPRWPDFPTGGPDVFASHPEVHAYVRWRFEPVTSLLSEVRESADPDVAIQLIDRKDGWVNGCDLAAASRTCDGAIVCAYDMPPAAVAALVRGSRAALGPETFLGIGFRLFYPEMADAANFGAKLEAAIATGCDGVNLYNYGLVPKARLGWIRQALSPDARCATPSNGAP